MDLTKMCAEEITKYIARLNKRTPMTLDCKWVTSLGVPSERKVESVVKLIYTESVDTIAVFNKTRADGGSAIDLFLYGATTHHLSMR